MWRADAGKYGCGAGFRKRNIRPSPSRSRPGRPDRSAARRPHGRLEWQRRDLSDSVQIRRVWRATSSGGGARVPRRWRRPRGRLGIGPRGRGEGSGRGTAVVPSPQRPGLVRRARGVPLRVRGADEGARPGGPCVRGTPRRWQRPHQEPAGGGRWGSSVRGEAGATGELLRGQQTSRPSAGRASSGWPGRRRPRRSSACRPCWSRACRSGSSPLPRGTARRPAPRPA